MLDQITPLIITYNEAANIERTLEKLLWARRIVVIDSGSTDDTIRLSQRHPQVTVISHPFSDFASQCNFGLTHVLTPWVLSLDADYEVSDELINELRSLTTVQGTMGYQVRFVYRIYGRPLRGSLYPPRTVLYLKERAFYQNDGHGHRLVLDGPIIRLHGVIYHDDRKSLSRWIASQQRYATEEVAQLLASNHRALSFADRIRLLGWPAPLGIFFYTLFVKGCVLDGWSGLYYVLQRVIAEALIALELLDTKLRRQAPRSTLSKDMT